MHNKTEKVERQGIHIAINANDRLPFFSFLFDKDYRSHKKTFTNNDEWRVYSPCLPFNLAFGKSFYCNIFNIVNVQLR